MKIQEFDEKKLSENLIGRFILA